MALSAAQRKANDKYIKENYRQVKLSMPKEEAEILETYCANRGLKKAGFIRAAIKEKMQRDQAQPTKASAQQEPAIEEQPTEPGNSGRNIILSKECKPMGISISDLQSLCNSGSIRWTVHILQRMIQRNISQNDVVESIQAGEIIEQYPDDYPHPSCLVLGVTIAGKYLHVVCGRGVDEIWMISAYTPSPAEWEDDLKTRKKGLQ